MIKKIIFLPPRTTTTRTQKKNTLPEKVRKEKKADIPEKKLNGTAQKRKPNRKNKITRL